MQDGFGRRIDYLRLSVTDLCNYRCKYCMPLSGVCKRRHEDICSIEELAEMTKQAAACGISKVRITGGEPLIRKGIIDLLKSVREIKGIKELCITTNGSLLTKYAGELKKAGVTKLNISIDTLQEKKFKEITRTGNLNEVLEGISAAEKAGFKEIKLNVVLIGGFNDDETEDFIRLTRYKPFEARFIELMPIGLCAAWDKSSFLTADTILQKCPQLVSIESKGVARRYQIPGYAGTVGFIQPMSHIFCKDCSRIRITADGKLKPCLHSDEEILLRGLHGEALRKQIENAIINKPLKHYLLENNRSNTHRSMNEIGG